VSSPELSIRVVGAEGVEGRIRGISAAVHWRLRAAVQGLGIELQGKVKVKLSDDVLHVRTGRLRRSITEATTDEGETIASRTGTNVAYGRAWELGFSGDVAVRAHERVSSMAFGRQVAPKTQQVSAHTRHVNMAPRPFLQPALAEMRDRIRERLSTAVAEAANGG